MRIAYSQALLPGVPAAALDEFQSGAQRRPRLETWFDEGVATTVRVSWDASSGLRWPKLVAELRRSGESPPIKDGLMAATVLAYGFIVVTRNTRDFGRTGVKVLDPLA